MTKQFKLMALASAVLLLGACADETVLNPEQAREANPESNAVQFETYMGKTTMTRAGATGSINTAKLKEAGYGFGVFAYYTGANTYQEATSYSAPGSGSGEHANGATGQTSLLANFMFNQQVVWDDVSTSGYITHWKYAPLKYWPNEVAAGAVDDQDNDAGNDPATTDNNNGGMVSFFAYAPYVDAGISATTDGIVKINGETTLAGANVKAQDPILTYIVAEDGSKMVDLLWGTYGGTTSNVLGGGNAGVAYNNGGTNYEKSILPHWTNEAKTTNNGYRVNADLTKQKTNGTIGIAFKHALAKVGGSEVFTPSDETQKHGLMVVLDLDDQKGAEVGGTKDNSTVVTITDVSIEARALVDADNDGTLEANEYLKSQQGDLNLATGYWSVLTTSNTGTAAEAAVTEHNITSPASEVSPSSATLNDAIAEPSSVTAFDDGGYLNSTTTLVGVLTTKQNVYKNEANPLVFIPGTYPELTITVNYTVRTKDANLANTAPGSGETGTWTKVKQVITKRVTFQNPVELNKQYSLLMHLGLTSVKFDATVSDWEIDGDTDGDGVIESGESVVVSDVWVPRNVGETASVEDAFSAGGTKTINVASSVSSVAVNITGLTKNTEYTTAVTAGGGTLSPVDVNQKFATADADDATGTTKNLTLTMPVNNTNAPVTHTFTVTESSNTYTVNIVQAAAPLTITRSKVEYEADAISTEETGVTYAANTPNGTSQTIDATGAYSLTANNDNWITTLGADNGLISAATANTTTLKRTAVISVKSGSSTGSVTITQKPATITISDIPAGKVTVSGPSDLDLSAATITITRGGTACTKGDAVGADVYVVSGKEITIPTGSGEYTITIKQNDAKATKNVTVS